MEKEREPYTPRLPADLLLVIDRLPVVPVLLRRLLRDLAEIGTVSAALDLKLHDIPNTVARAVESAANLGVQMLTIHLSGGSEMIRAATAARANNISILGVSVLTSATEQTLREIGISNKVNDQVLRLAKLGVEEKIDGIVASPHEIKVLRAEFGDKVKIVVQGIRPSWAHPRDQKRFMTPRAAIAAGADYIGIGRPITTDPNPRDATSKILTEIGA